MAICVCACVISVCQVFLRTIQAKINISMSYTPPEGAGGDSSGGGSKQAGDGDDEEDWEITVGERATDGEEPAAGETLTGEGGGKTSAATEEA